MPTVTITVNGKKLNVNEGMTIMQAADESGIYIPRLCSHPDLIDSRHQKPVNAIYRGGIKIENKGHALPDFGGCRLCLVRIDGMDMLQTACSTLVSDGMVVSTDSPEIEKQRRDNLAKIVGDHPHACLLCAQKDGCTREPCSSNVPKDERCCPKLGNCEFERVADYIGINPNTRRYIPKKIPVLENEPLFRRDYNLCINCTRCVRACRELRGVNALGFVFVDGKPVVGSIAPTLGESGCRFCGACVSVCPTGALTDKDIPHVPNEKHLVPCKAECPAGINIPAYLRLASDGRMDDALLVVLEKVPFPSVLGRICFHPCETVCRRGKINQPVAICSVKRTISDIGAQPEITIKPATGRKVAIVGSGPAGLTCAYYLARLGHIVTIYESENIPGGMLSAAIPDYRLPIDVLEKDLYRIRKSGIEIITGKRIGRDIRFSVLTKEYDAVFIATGAPLSKKLNLPGSELQGVMWGLDFLRDAKKNRCTCIGKNVIVIGGGNVAIDVARTAKRLGAVNVSLFCLECDEEMPAHDWEVEEARLEGVDINVSWGPNKIIGESGTVTGIELIKCTSVFDETGRFNPSFDRCVIKQTVADSVIFAVGQKEELPFSDEEKELYDTFMRVRASAKSSFIQLGSSSVFAGGDVVRMPGTAIDAIAAGRDAASAIDKYLGGDGNIDETLVPNKSMPKLIGRIESFPEITRQNMPTLPVRQRHTGFNEVEMGYSVEEAVSEARRCLQCDLRTTLRNNPLPPDKFILFNEKTITSVPEREGVFQLLDENRETLMISGVMNMRKALMEKLGNCEAVYFTWEEDSMYTKRESELIQKHIQKTGKMPKLNDELDDLF